MMTKLLPILALTVAAVPATAATISTVTPAQARLDALQEFVIDGTGLGVVDIPGCTRQTRRADAPADTSTRVYLRCVPRLSGIKPVRVGGVAVAGSKVLFDLPARSGSASARGLPQIGGVSLWNGNFNLQATDITVSGKGPAFVLSRSYNTYFWQTESARGAVDNFKPWRFNWERRIGFVPDTGNTQIFVQQADGSSRSFFRHTDGQWYPMDQGNFDKLVVGTSDVKVYGRDGITTTWQPIANGGRLVNVADAHGLNLSVTHGNNGMPARVVDTNGLTYVFTYDSGNRLISVNDSLTRRVEYTWECGLGSLQDPARACGAGEETQQRLKTVKDLRGNVTSYQYAYFPAVGDLGGRMFLVSATDPRKNVAVQLTHEASVYGNWGVVAVANGENETWRFNFCAEDANGACGPTDRAQRFKTTVTPPLGAQRISYFNTSGRPAGGVNGRGLPSAASSVDASALDETRYNRAALPVERRSARAVAQGYASAQYDHDADGLLKSVRDAEAGLQQTAWTAADRARNLFCAASTTSPSGLTASTTRDALCRVTAMAQPGKPAAAVSYTKLGFPNHPTQVVGPRQDRTVLDYFGTGALLKSVGPMGETTSSTYDRLGRQLTQTNPLLGITRYQYEGVTNLVTQVTDPLNRITRSTYDANGNLATRHAPNGQVTTYTYDKANRLIETSTTVTTATGPQVVRNRTVYDALGRVRQTINANNNASTGVFDEAGNVVQRANALSHTTTYDYDEDNRVVKVTDPVGRVTETIYDKLGRVSSVTTPAGSQSYEYDADGRVVLHRDARNNATRYRYAPGTGHLIEVVDALNNTTSAEYDAAGNVVAITDPNRNTTRFEFDKSNRRTKRTDPNGHVWTWEYDNAGNVRFARAPGGLVTEYVYDAASQLKQTRLSDGQVIAFEYDLNGNRIKMTDATGITVYAYDGLNRLTQVTDPRGQVLKYAYDPAGNRVALTYPNNKVVTYGFDAAERMVTVADWLGKTHTYTLNAAGQVTQLAMGNGTKATMTYDAASRLRSLVNTGPGDSVISSHTMQMDGEGNFTEVAVQLPLLPAFGTSANTMTYDAANRLATFDGAAVVNDDAGRLTSFGSEGYTYDSRDLLTSIAGPNAGSNTYNGAGHRVARSAGGNITRYVIDPSTTPFSVISESNGSGALQRSYIYGYGLLMQISSVDAPTFYHFDPTGSTLALTDATGAITDRYAYTPYGKTTSLGGAVNPYRFIGRYGVADDQNGLHYMRARYYTSGLARFLSLDVAEGQAANPEQLNRYQYVSGRPLTLTDPSGKCPQEIASCPSGSEVLGAAVGIGEASTSQFAPFSRTGYFDNFAAKQSYFFRGTGTSGLKQGLNSNFNYFTNSSYKASLTVGANVNFSLKAGGTAMLVYDAGQTYFEAREALENNDLVAAEKAFGSFAVGSTTGYISGSVVASACVASAAFTGPVGPAICLIGGVLVGATVSHVAGGLTEVLIDPETWKRVEQSMLEAKVAEAERMEAQRSRGYLPNVGRTINDPVASYP